MNERARVVLPSQRFAVHQALFGYKDGHRLLNSSTKLAGETLATLARLTDGTAAESYVGFDGYLSGYPLPNGHYALSRTWQAKEASRPGAVWTHVLLVDATILASLESADGLVDLLRRPQGMADLPAYGVAVEVSPRFDREREVVAGDWREVLSALYSSDTGTVWRTADRASDVESDALAVWWWQWPALRRQFSFCMGGSGRRTVSSRDFDLVVVPTSKRLSAVADFGVPSSKITAAGTLVDADLHGQMPSSYRAYLRFCGAETRRRSAVGLLSDIWMAAEDPDGHPARIQRRIATRVRNYSVSPSNMRRLKRSVIVPKGRLRARWKPADSAALLILTDFGDCVRAGDVALDDLMYAVREEPTLLLQAASGRGRSSVLPNGDSWPELPEASDESPRRIEFQWALSGPAGDGESVAGAAKSPTELTVAQVLPDYGRVALARFARPTWLEEIAEVGGVAVAEVLLSAAVEEREAWARAFWALRVDRAAEASVAYTALLRSGGRFQSHSLGWLAAFAGEPGGGAAWLAHTHTSRPARRAALHDFVDALLSFSSEVRWVWRAAIHDASLLREVIEMAPHVSDVFAKVLLLITDPTSPETIAAGLHPWKAISPSELNAVESAHLLRVVPYLDVSGVWLVSQAFAKVWDACAVSDWLVWEALGDYPAQFGFGQDWDRARRVSHRYAKVLIESVSVPLSGGDDLIGLALQGVHEICPRAAMQLSAELTVLAGESNSGLEHDSASAKRSKRGKKGKARGPIEQARQIASDWLGFG